jgi:hypothetical protein
MSGRPAMPPMDTIALPGKCVASSLHDIEALQRDHETAAGLALDAMHKELSVGNAKKRARSRRAHDAKRGTELAQFVPGDYVLYQGVWQHKREKLRTTWCGPTVMTGVVSPWVYMVKKLITADCHPSHAVRIRFYSDVALNVTEDFLAHVAH